MSSFTSLWGFSLILWQQKFANGVFQTGCKLRADIEQLSDMRTQHTVAHVREGKEVRSLGVGLRTWLRPTSGTAPLTALCARYELPSLSFCLSLSEEGAFLTISAPQFLSVTEHCVFMQANLWRTRESHSNLHLFSFLVK